MIGGRAETLEERWRRKTVGGSNPCFCMNIWQLYILDQELWKAFHFASERRPSQFLEAVESGAGPGQSLFTVMFLTRGLVGLPLCELCQLRHNDLPLQPSLLAFGGRFAQTTNSAPSDPWTTHCLLHQIPYSSYCHSAPENIQRGKEVLSCSQRRWRSTALPIHKPFLVHQGKLEY